MLYDLWLRVVHQFKSEIALRELATGSHWTFAQLAEAAERHVPRAANVQMPDVCFPQGNDAGFVLDMLAGWRTSSVVCPLEPGQIRPQFTNPLPKAVVHLKTTSASTGSPRMVAFRAEQLIADAENIVQTMGLRPEWPNLGLISLAHSYGFSNLVLPLALHGIPLVLVGAPLPEALRQACAAGDQFTVPAVPALWRMWYEAGALPPNIRLAISAGAPLPVELEQTVFARTGIKIHNLYGSSECGGIAYDSTARPRTEPSLAGEPLKNVQLTVGPDGCLQVHGSAVGQGYWPQGSERLAKGIFHTSDLAEFVDGRVYLRGRATDLINIAGRKVSPETIEQTLLSHPRVRECVVFGISSPTPEHGDRIVAAIRVDGPPCRDLLKGFLAERIPSWQLPREWWFVDSFAINDRGKLSRAELKVRYLEVKQNHANRIQNS